MNIRNDTGKSENPMDNLSNPNFQFTSVFGLLAIYIENFCNLHIGGYSHYP